MFNPCDNFRFAIPLSYDESLSYMEQIARLYKVVQNHENRIAELEKKIAELEGKMYDM